MLKTQSMHDEADGRIDAARRLRSVWLIALSTLALLLGTMCMYRTVYVLTFDGSYSGLRAALALLLTAVGLAGVARCRIIFYLGLSHLMVVPYVLLPIMRGLQ